MSAGKTTSAGKKNVQKEEEQGLDPKFMKAIDYVYSKLPTKTAVFNDDRAHIFTATKLFNFLKTQKHKNLPKFETDEQIISFASQMARTGLIARREMSPQTQRLLKEGEKNPTIVLVTHKLPNTFEVEDKYSVYMWIYKGGQTSLKFMSFGLIILSIGMCLIKVWPLWLKIVVYWLSLTMLVTLSSLIVIRLCLFCIAWVIGFKGFWLFPNLLNDEISFLETFKPAFGKGIEEEKTSGASADNDKDASLVGGTSNWDFGIINLLLLVTIGVGFCWGIGLFDSEAIPDFVVNQHELFRSYPALAPPNYDPNQTPTPTPTPIPTQQKPASAKNKNKKSS